MNNALSTATAHKEISKEPVPCPVCDSTNFVVKYQPTNQISDPYKLYGAASGVRGTQTLVQCDDCGMLYENPRYPREVIISGYSMADDSGHDTQHKMRVKSFYKALRSLQRYLPDPGARVLDIGTAGGAFLEAAKLAGYDAVGLEPSACLVESGKKRGLNIIEGTLPNKQLPQFSFDLVCLWDVLEHVVDPKEMLREIRPLLKPDGMLLINYPDIGTWQAKIAGEKFWWLLSVHIQHFSPASIAKICELTGFEVFRSSAYWQTLELGYLVGIAKHLKVPFAAFAQKILPASLGKLPFPYYASQTTALARLKL